MKTKANSNNVRLFRLKNLTAYCGLSRAYIYKKISDGTFPPGARLSVGVRVWEKDQIDSWIDAQMGRV